MDATLTLEDFSPHRTAPHRQQQRLESDIALLESESRTYAETWQARKLAFDAIVHSLETMQEAIRCVPLPPPLPSLLLSSPLLLGERGT